MKILYDHVFGLQNHAEVYHFSATLIDVAPDQHDEALSQGWLVTARNRQPKWYQSRSTRCDLSKVCYDLMPGAELLDPVPHTELDHIYSAYCLHKGYRKYFEIKEHLDWDQYIGYRDVNHELCAWSKLRHYSAQALETVLFAWDYADPAQRLGEKSLWHELAWAKQRGYRWVYMGPGYEKNNLYKSKVTGFEWWTGSSWSQDIDHYVWLCQRDSRISSCLELHDLSGK